MTKCATCGADTDLVVRTYSVPLGFQRTYCSAECYEGSGWDFEYFGWGNWREDRPALTGVLWRAPVEQSRGKES
jgi:hypothetical protein